MFGRTIICIYNDQPNDNPRPKKPEFTPNETYSDYDTGTTQTQSDTESENETENQAETQNKPKNKSQKEVKKSEQNIHKTLRTENNTKTQTNQNSLWTTPPKTTKKITQLYQIQTLNKNKNNPKIETE